MRFELLVAPKRFDGYMVKMALKLEEKLLELIVKCWDSNGWDLPNQESWRSATRAVIFKEITG